MQDQCDSRKRKVDPNADCCPVCFEIPYNAMVAVPCGHTVCEECSAKIENRCAMCRKKITYAPNYMLRTLMEGHPTYAQEYKRIKAEKEFNTPESIIQRYKDTVPGFELKVENIPLKVVAYLIPIVIEPTDRVKNLTEMVRANQNFAFTLIGPNGFAGIGGVTLNAYFEIVTEYYTFTMLLVHRYIGPIYALDGTVLGHIGKPKEESSSSSDED